MDGLVQARMEGISGLRSEPDVASKLFEDARSCGHYLENIATP